MAGGGDNRGSIAGVSDKQKGVRRSADRRCKRTTDSFVVNKPPTPKPIQDLHSLPALSIQPTDIPEIPPREEDYAKDFNVDEMKAAGALIMMKQQDSVLQPQPQQGKKEQNPKRRKFHAVDKDHHQANAAGAFHLSLTIARRRRSHWVVRPRKLSVAGLEKYVR